MHATFQPDGRSPKQVNGSTLTSQLKSASENGQNSGAYPSQVKGKKRERVEHVADPIKRERTIKAEETEFLQFKTENKLKCEIARITEKGGGVDFEGVEKLVQLMGTERMERKMDLVSRSILAGVMAATDRVDCLNRFIYLRGLPILDEWLQDIHKGKIGDANGKDSEKTVDEFLLVLLRALDKLPVNLQALQMCNIGRSVNHLRSHKNLEIQKKARSLVDTWKKRVEAEMISGDTRPSKPRLLDAGHGGSRLTTPSGSDLAMKSSVTQNSSPKTTSMRSHVESFTTKSATSSPGPVKPTSSSPTSCKEGQPSNSAGGSPDVPLTREDRSSSSNQSHNYSQSLSGKDDAKSLTGGSVIVNKSVSCNTRSRKVSNFPVSVTGTQKEANSGRSPSGHKTTGVEKLSQPILSSSERVLEGPVNEGSSHKLIVKIPNRVGSPALGVSSASLEDTTYTSCQTSSPVLADRHGQFDRTVKERSNVHQNAAADVNVGLLKNNGPKDVLSIPTEGVGSPAVPDKENSMATVDSRGLVEDPQKNDLSSGKLHGSSFGPMNALIESCAKYSEATSSLSPGDDIGMNLLASVATGEISRSDMVSHDNSTEKSTRAVDGTCMGDDARSNDNEIEEKDISGRDVSKDSSRMSLRSNGGPKREIFDTLVKNSGLISASLSTSDRKVNGGEIKEENHGATYSKTIADGILARRSDGINDMMADGKIPSLSSHESKLTVDATAPTQLSQGDCKKDASETMNTGTNSQQILSSPSVKSEFVERPTDEKLQRIPSILESNIEVGDKVKAGEPNEKNVEDRAAAGELNSMDGSSSTSNDLKNDLVNVQGNPGPVDHVAQEKAESRGSKPANVQPDEAVECGAEVSSSSAAGTSDVKMKFDLNEGFSNDDGKEEDHLTLISSSAPTGHIINSSQFSVNSIHNGHSASITVAAAAKGPFLPPEDLLKSKGELRWKGSAATSAFRPAEPRKVEIPFGSASSCPDASSSKHGRVVLDFDLNVPDESLLEEMAARDSALAVDSATNLSIDRATLFNKSTGSMRSCGSGGLDLDLNRTDEANDNGHCSSSNRDSDSSILHVRSVVGLPSGDVRRNFDLNDGPVVDETGTGNDLLSFNQQIKGSVPAQLASGGLRMSGPGLGSYASWFPPGNTYSSVAIPSMLPDRADQQFPVFPPSAPQRTFGPSGVHPFSPDIYRGSVLSSSPAMSFPSSHFQYSIFPFGATFPLPSTTFQAGGNSYADSASVPRLFAPTVNPQLLGPVSTMTSQLPRPFMVGLPDNISDGGPENNRKWARQGLDLNAGPGALENEARPEMMSLPSGQHSLSSTQALAGNILKRREPEGGLENENFRFKQSSWQ